MKLAWSNLLHNPLRLLVTVAGIAFASFIMLFQTALFIGFLRASSSVVESSDADLFVTAHGASCLEFGGTIPERFRYLAFGVPGVSHAARVVVGVTYWLKPSGVQEGIVLVGAEAEVGDGFPRPRASPDAFGAAPDTVLVDESNTAALGVDEIPEDVEINGYRARVLGIVSGFGSFLGSPYVFADYRDAQRFLHRPSDGANFILLRVEEGYRVEDVGARLRERFPEVDVRTRAEFIRRSRLYWIIQTGSGAALLTTGLLGLLVGIVFVSQGIYSTTMEKIEEYATLRALGASRVFVSGIVLLQALLSGVAGCAVGLLAAKSAAALVSESIPWLHAPAWLFAFIVFTSLVMSGVAAIASVRVAITVEPGRVFRA